MKKQIGIGGLTLTAEDKALVMKTLDSNRLSHGPFSEQLEAEFSRLHDCEYGVFCNSGTSALHISLAALKEIHGWKDGDEVLVPAITFVATSNVVLHNYMKPVFVDVDPTNFGIDPSKLEEKITSRTRAIIPVHLFGLPCDMDPVLEIARKHQLKIIEDSCETMFVKYRDRSIGSFGEIGCFSTYVAHLLVTGVGGFAITSDPKLAIILKSLMNHGRDAIYLNIDDDQNTTREKLHEIVAGRFRFVRLGHSFRATEMEAAIGLGQLSRREEMLRKRRRNASYLTKGLSHLEDFIQLAHCPDDREHAYMMYPIVVKDPRISRNDLVNFLEENSVETRDMMPLINQPLYIELFGNLESQYPIAAHINRNGFYIGCHPQLGKDDLDYVLGLFRDFFSRKGLKNSKKLKVVARTS